MEIVNLTQHDIVYQYEDGTRITYPPSGQICRVTTTFKEVECLIPGQSAITRHYQSLKGFPNDPDTVYIVSNPCLDFVPRDSKVVAPANGPNEGCIRDRDGQVEAVTRWTVPTRSPITLGSWPEQDLYHS